MRSAFFILHNYFNQATNSERDIIDYIIKNPNNFIELNARELAKITFTSPSTVVRLCKKMNFSGFNDLKNYMIYELALKQIDKSDVVNDVERSDTIENIISKITKRNALSLENSAKMLDPNEIKKAIELMVSANSINLFGMGASLLVAKDALLKFIRINKSCIVYEDYHTQTVLARNMKDTDLAMFFSYSGKTKEMINIANEVLKRGVKIILITGFPNSKLGALADIILPVSSIEHIYRSGAMSSRIAQMNVVDILYASYINQTYEKSLENISRTYIEKELEEDNE